MGDQHRRIETLELEYETLRSEITESIRNQVRILGYGGTAISILLGLGVIRRSMLLLVSLPFLAFFFFVLWNVEQTRMMRAGDYIALLEDRVAETYEEPTLSWENWLRYRSEHPERDIYQLHYVAQYAILGLFATLILMGIVNLWVWNPGAVEFPIAVALSVLYAIFFAVSTYLGIKTVRHEDIRDSLQFFLDSYRDRLTDS